MDLGYANDWTALTFCHLDAGARVVVDVVRTWIGTSSRPVAFTEVEAAIIDLARRFRPRRIVLDQWQAKMLAERLQGRGLPAVMVSVEQTRLDKLITVIQSAFNRRQIRLSSRHVDLIAQLESVRTMEGRGAKRDLLKFAPSGTGPSAGQHDDLVVSLGLAIEALATIGQRVGERRVSGACNVAEYFGRPSGCLLEGGGGIGFPGQHGAVCRACPSWIDVKAEWERAGKPGDLRASFAANYRQPPMSPENWAARASMS